MNNKTTERPLIGIISGFAGTDKNRKFAPAGRVNFADLNYLECVENAGGLPCIIPYVRDHDSMKQYCAQVDGIVLMGGVDVAAERYGQAAQVSEWEAIPERDTFEFMFTEMFLETGKPVFAICRGYQLINVLYGGNLIQDMPSMLGVVHHMQSPGALEISHSVRLEADSMIARILGREAVDVNSFHHQCVDRLGKGLRPTGVSEEGIVEVYEHKDHPYLLAVQWHPERMRHHDRQMLLFRNFIKVSRESKLVQS